MGLFDPYMRALTLWRPWSDAISRGPKRVENRSWVPPSKVLGSMIGLHAGKKYDRGDWPMAEGYEPPLSYDSPTGLVGVARVVGALDLRKPTRTYIYPESPDEAEIVDRLDALDLDPWWAGPVGWLLADVVSFEPVSCKGSMGLWSIPPPELDLVRQRLEALGV